MPNQIVCYPETCDEHRGSRDTHGSRNQVNSIGSKKWISRLTEVEPNEAADSYYSTQ